MEKTLPSFDSREMASIFLRDHGDHTYRSKQTVEDQGSFAQEVRLTTTQMCAHRATNNSLTISVAPDPTAFLRTLSKWAALHRSVKSTHCRKSLKNRRRPSVRLRLNITKHVWINSRSCVPLAFVHFLNRSRRGKQKPIK